MVLQLLIWTDLFCHINKIIMKSGTYTKILVHTR